MIAWRRCWFNCQDSIVRIHYENILLILFRRAISVLLCNESETRKEKCWIAYSVWFELIISSNFTHRIIGCIWIWTLVCYIKLILCHSLILYYLSYVIFSYSSTICYYYLKLTLHQLTPLSTNLGWKHVFMASLWDETSIPGCEGHFRVQCIVGKGHQGHEDIVF